MYKRQEPEPRYENDCVADDSYEPEPCAEPIAFAATWGGDDWNYDDQVESETEALQLNILADLEDLVGEPEDEGAEKDLSTEAQIQSMALASFTKFANPGSKGGKKGGSGKKGKLVRKHAYDKGNGKFGVRLGGKGKRKGKTPSREQRKRRCLLYTSPSPRD